MVSQENSQNLHKRSRKGKVSSSKTAKIHKTYLDSQGKKEKTQIKLEMKKRR
jgi:hypothetical protein